MNAYDLSQLVREDRPFLRVIFPAISFVSKRAPADLELAVGYAAALARVTARFMFRRRRFDRMRPDRRIREVRREEQVQRLPPPGGHGIPVRPVGPEGREVPYGAARPRRPADGPDAHYLRDHRWKVDPFGDPGVMSLPCVACEGKQASEPCAPGCSAPGGMCSAIWWVPTIPDVLGPHWEPLVREIRRVSHELSVKEGAAGAAHGVKGAPHGARGGRPSGNSRLAEEAVDLLSRRD